MSAPDAKPRRPAELPVSWTVLSDSRFQTFQTEAAARDAARRAGGRVVPVIDLPAGPAPRTFGGRDLPRPPADGATGDDEGWEATDLPHDQFGATITGFRIGTDDEGNASVDFRIESPVEVAYTDHRQVNLWSDGLVEFSDYAEDTNPIVVACTPHEDGSVRVRGQWSSRSGASLDAHHTIRPPEARSSWNSLILDQALPTLLRDVTFDPWR